MTLRVLDNYLIQGDALAPDAIDLITQVGSLPVGAPVPEGWRVLTSNNTDSMVARSVFRFEIEGGQI